MFNCSVEDKQIKVQVVRSFLKNVNVGDEVVMVNNEPVIDFITRNAGKYIKRTYAALTAIKKYTLFMCLQNPFDPIKSLTIRTIPTIIDT